MWKISVNFAWILGLSILLASWSYGYYEAKIDGRSMRDLYSSSRYQAATSVGLVLFCVGLAATDNRWWMQILWFTLGVFIISKHIGRRHDASND